MAEETLLGGQPAGGADPNANPEAGKQSDAGKPGEAAKEGGAGDADKDKQSQGAPEKYADFRLPEGVTLTAEEVSDLQGVAKELNLTQEQAQKLADREVKARQTAEGKLQTQVADTHKAWRTAATADKEYGGEKLAENLGVAKKALDAFGCPELRQMLEASGLGNHPEAIRFFVRVGKAVSEDKLVAGRPSGGAGDQRDARSFYPNSNHAA